MTENMLDYWMSLAREIGSKFNIETFDASSDLWNWDNFKEEISDLKGKHGVTDHVDLLGLRVNLETGTTIDLMTNSEVSNNRIIPHLYYYSKAKDKGIAEEWVKFNSLQGSFACRFSYNEEDLGALTSAYMEKREKLFEAIEQLGGKRVDYGDAAFEISFLPKVKVLIVFEDEDDEFPASVRMLFDKNSIYYLPHEMLGDISWFLVSRAYKAM